MVDKAKIGDDWEDVVDSYSVISLSSDDGDDGPVVHDSPPKPKDVETTPMPSENPWRSQQPTPRRDEPDARLLSPTDAPPASPPPPYIDPPGRDKLTEISPIVVSSNTAPFATPSKVAPAWPLMVSQPAETMNVWSQRVASNAGSKGKAVDTTTSDEVERLAAGVRLVDLNGDSELFGRKYSHKQKRTGLQEDWDESDDALNEVINRRVDPTFFLKVLKSLADVAQETVDIAPEPQPQDSHTVQRIVWVCKMLHQQLRELEPIVSGYAKHHEQNTPVRGEDIPLDPSLYTWMSGLRIKLLAVQADILNRARRSDGSPTGPAEPDRDCSELEKNFTALSEFKKQMDDFLPIMQGDFKDYQSNRFTRPPPQPTTLYDTSDDLFTNYGGPRRYGGYPAPDVDRLRWELYALKDEIGAVIEQIDNFRSCLSPTEARTASDIIGTLRSVFNAISLALTNSESEWLDWGISSDRRGLTHAEFCSLNPRSISDFTLRIHQVYEVLNIERDPVVQTTWSPQMLQDHRRHMLVEENQLGVLENLADVLLEVLVPNRT